MTLNNKCIWCCYKANSLTSKLLNHLLSEIGLFTLHSCCVHWTIESKSLIPIPEFFCSHCMFLNSFLVIIYRNYYYFPKAQYKLPKKIVVFKIQKLVINLFLFYNINP